MSRYPRSFVSSILFVSLAAVGGISQPVQAQERASTFVGTGAGGWAGPCEPLWSTTEWSFNAKRVCRVTSALARSVHDTLSAEQAQQLADRLFRICWGVFPAAGGNCQSPNAWASLGSWNGRTEPVPAVITLLASERVQSDDELAFLIAHEMGHAFDQRQRLLELNPEQRADISGVGFLVKAGFDARAGGRALQTLGGERGQGPLGNLAGILLNHMAAGRGDIHGLTRDRIALMKSVFATGCASLRNQPVGCKEGWR
jgi:hypothetical protein